MGDYDYNETTTSQNGGGGDDSYNVSMCMSVCPGGM